MLQFFIALFGCIYLLFSYINSKLTERDIDEYINKVESIKRELEDIELEIDLVKKLSSQKTLKETAAPIAEDMNEIFGDNWLYLLDRDYIGYKNHGSLYYPFSVALQLLLSKQGKITGVSSIGGYTLAPEGSELSQRELIVAKKIEENIQAFYPSFSFVFIPRIEQYSPKTVYSKSLAGGSLVWNFTIDKPDRETKKVMRSLW